MYMNFNKGDMVEFFSHIRIEDGHAFEAGYPKLYETVLDTGIIVSDVFGGNEENIDGETPKRKRVCISIPRYNGDYRVEDLYKLTKKDVTPEDKLSLIGQFGSWWYYDHKSLYQSILVEALN